MEKIRRMSACAAAVIIPFLIYYPYKALQWQLNMSFLEPDRWLRSGWSDVDAVIAPLTRAIYFAFWFPPLLAGIGALLTALSLVIFMYRGVLFDDRIAQRIMWLGRFTMASSGLHILAACVSPKIVSWHNAGGALPLRFWYSSAHISLILCGLAFLLMGAVLRQAIVVARENEAFV